MKLWLLGQVVYLAAYPLRVSGSRSSAQARFYRFARFIAAALRPFVRSRPGGMPPIEAAIVNQLITFFNRREPGFPLMIKLNGEHHIDAAERLGKGVLIATVHTRLALASHAALQSDRGSPLIVGRLANRDIRGWNWGHAKPLDTIEARNPMLFRKLARHLASGRRVVCFVDHGQSTDRPGPMGISPNLFLWAQSAGIPVVFMLSRLNDQGVIEITLHHEQSGSAADSIGSFIRFIEREGGWRCDPDRRRAAIERDKAVTQPQRTTASDCEIAIAA